MRFLRAALAASLCAAAALATGSGASSASNSAPAPVFSYVTMPDGVQLAVVTSFPRGFVRAKGRWPSLFEMDGYEGGAGPVDPGYWGDRYVIVHASVRGQAAPADASTSSMVRPRKTAAT